MYSGVFNICMVRIKSKEGSLFPFSSFLLTNDPFLICICFILLQLNNPVQPFSYNH